MSLFKNGWKSFLLYALILGIGVWLRLDQFCGQVLIDDEWHPIHQLVLHTPREIMLSFGFADYSIPLTLLYWWEAQISHLSELGMRWPMLLCGVAALVLFPLYAWKTAGKRVAILFAAMLAMSPLLVIFSQTARPYAITLLLAYLAHHSFAEYAGSRPHWRLWGFLYGLSAVLATWMHLIVGPFVVAPFVLEGIAILGAASHARSPRLRRYLLLAGFTATGMMLCLLPPLLMHSEVLAAKGGADLPDWQTVVGAWHLWTGTPFALVALAMLLLAAFGWLRLWHDSPVVRSATVGLTLTLIAIFLTRPAWIQHPLTFGRYLLPMLPLLLFCAAAGTVRVADSVVRIVRRPGMNVATAILFLPPVILAYQSPLEGWLQQPNNNHTHSIFAFDFRPGDNLIQQWSDANIPLSPYWEKLALQPRESLRVAVAPFHFESYNWDAPRWERISGQTIVPGFLSGLCVEWRLGEVPESTLFGLRNAAFLGDPANLAARRIDRVAYQKPFTVTEKDGTRNTIGGDTANCEEVMRLRFGPPTYEDDNIVVFSLEPARDASEHVER